MATEISDIECHLTTLAKSARVASRSVATLSGADRDTALHTIAAALRERSEQIIAANALDLAAGRAAGLSSALIERLILTQARIEKMAAGVDQIAGQVDPIGQIIEGHVRPNGLRIEKRRVPLGVIGFIYESRPNVTSDASALCLKSGNALILRGGKEAINSNRAIVEAIASALRQISVDPSAIQLVQTTDRAAVDALLRQDRYIDLIIPRGGESLIRAVTRKSTIPVIKHYTGNCHVYVDVDAEIEQAVEITVNAKCQRPGVCNAAESLLVHQAISADFLPAVGRQLAAQGVQMRGCVRSRELVDAEPATDEDWTTEFLDTILAIKVVDDLESAIEHINNYGSGHTDVIVSDSKVAIDQFVAAVDSASIMVNCSSRFSDGGEYGLGAEIGISTDKLHARGPMGAADLTTYKWIVTGEGQIKQ